MGLLFFLGYLNLFAMSIHLKMNQAQADHLVINHHPLLRYSHKFDSTLRYLLILQIPKLVYL